MTRPARGRPEPAPAPPAGTGRPGAGPGAAGAAAGAVLRVTRWVKIAPRVWWGPRGRESGTRISGLAPADPPVGSPPRGAGAWAVASIGLSRGFPATVSTGVTS